MPISARTSCLLKRLHSLSGVVPGGLEGCGNAQDSVEVCPRVIPLTEAFGELGRQTLKQGLRRLLGR